MLEFLTQTATISRWSTRTANSSNNYELTPSYTPIAANVPCSIQQKSVTNAKTEGGLAVAFQVVGYFKAGLDLRPGSSDDARADRVTVDGTTYEVVGVLQQTSRNQTLKAILRRL